MNSAEGATRRRCRLLQKKNPKMMSVRRMSPPTTPPAIAPAFLLECDACPALEPELSGVLLIGGAVIVGVSDHCWGGDESGGAVPVAVGVAVGVSESPAVGIVSKLVVSVERSSEVEVEVSEPAEELGPVGELELAKEEEEVSIEVAKLVRPVVNVVFEARSVGVELGPGTPGGVGARVSERKVRICGSI